MTEPSPLDAHLGGLAAALRPFRGHAAVLATWGERLAWHLGRGGRLLVCGNGGSAAEAQHLAAELVGRLRDDRVPLSAIALTADSSAVTAIGNDYGYDEVFARQVRAHGRPGDVLMALSTSGHSPNVRAAVRAARETGMRTWAMAGAGPSPVADACDEVLCCPSADSQVVQELHLVAVHVLCEYVDRTLPAVLAGKTPPVVLGRAPDAVMTTGPVMTERTERSEGHEGMTETGPVMTERTERSEGVTSHSGERRPLLVVVGDVLLDRDIEGSVDRVTPDAPALVLAEESVADRPGGAGLAAVLAAGDGCEVALVAALADDPAGARLGELLTAAGVEVYPLGVSGSTPEKVRLRARGQILLRLDRGGAPAPPAGDVPEAVLALFERAAAILVSDYGRGVTRHPRLRAAIGSATAPVVWDPHPNGSPPVPGVRLVTPNEAEVRALTGDAGGGSALTVARRAGYRLRQRWRAGAVAVTRGADGAVLCHAGPTPLVVPTPGPAGGDTCGAGDRFAASAAVALASGALVSEAVQEAVAAATAYVAAGGVTTALRPEGPGPGEQGTGKPRPEKRGTEKPGTGEPRTDGDHPVAYGTGEVTRLLAGTRARGGTVVATGGCFDLLHAGHIATLQAARRLGDCLVVCLNSDDSVRALKGPDRPLTSQADRRRMLAALDGVDAVVIFDEPTPEAVLSWIRPDVWVKGGDYTDPPEADLVRHWGGQCVIVPYLDGRSTTRTIAAARGEMEV